MSENSNWYDSLDNEIFYRLAECRTKKEDLSVLVEAKWDWWEQQGISDMYTKDDAVDEVLELLDCNGLNFDLTVGECADLAGF